MINCADLRCKYCNNFECTHKAVKLALKGVQTVHQGMQYLLKCDSFEEDEQYKEIRKILAEAKEELLREEGAEQ